MPIATCTSLRGMEGRVGLVLRRMKCCLLFRCLRRRSGTLTLASPALTPAMVRADSDRGFILSLRRSQLRVFAEG